MRAYASLIGPAATALVIFAAACALPKLDTGSDSTSATTADSGVAYGADAGFVGGGCGSESTTGTQLCVATSMCPTLVVDTSAMPHCGFRVRNGVPDLVCACGTSLCSMGVFDTCDQASNLLLTQSEAAVCVQVADGRCEDISGTPVVAATSTSSSTSSTSSTSSSASGGTGCDAQCVKDCGGGEACASVCNCN
jgi:hypothetical protein